MARAPKASGRHLHLVGVADEDAALLARVRPSPAPETVVRNAHLIDTYTPRRGSAPEVLAVVAFLRPFLLACDLSAGAVRNALRFLPRLGVRQVRVGLPLSLASVLGVAAVERYLAEEGAHESTFMKSGITSSAGLVGRALNMPDYPRRHSPHSRADRRAPYTDDDFEEYLAAASRLSYPLRDNATTLIMLGRAGINTSRIRYLDGTDIIRYRRRWSIVVPHIHPAQIRPLPAMTVDFLRQRAEKVGTKPLLRPGMSRKRCVAETVEQFADHTLLPPFLVSRAVSAWQVEILNATSITAFQQITALSPTGNAIRDLFPYLNVPSPSQCWDLAITAANRTR